MIHKGQFIEECLTRQTVSIPQVSLSTKQKTTTISSQKVAKKRVTSTHGRPKLQLKLK